MKIFGILSRFNDLDLRQVNDYIKENPQNTV